MSSLLRVTVLGIVLGAALANAGANDDSGTASDGIGFTEELTATMEEALAADGAVVAPGVEASLDSSTPVSGQTAASPAPDTAANPPVSTAIEPEVVTVEFAARVAAARVQLDALFAARAAGDGTSSLDAIAAKEELEKEVAVLESAVNNLAWRAERVQAYWAEIEAMGFSLPANTIPYEVDQQRSFHERDTNPATTIEVAPRLVYATQRKATYQNLATLSKVPEGDLVAGEKFLYVGVLRTPSARRVFGWVLGRGQVIVTDNDIASLDGK